MEPPPLRSGDLRPIPASQALGFCAILAVGWPGGSPQGAPQISRPLGSQRSTRSRMRLDSSEVANSLRRTGARALFHANSVATACTFLSQGALLSRGTVEDRGLPQTSQPSDPLDKKHKIWRDIFLDAVDIHDRIARRNLYGPVLFVFHMEALEHTPVTAAWITRKNPTKWKTGEPRALRFFRSTTEFAETYTLGDFDSMIVLRDVVGILPLKGNLSHVLVDDPGQLTFPHGKVEPLPGALKALRAAARDGGLRYLRIRVRKCSTYCGCHADYNTYPFRTRSIYDAT